MEAATSVCVLNDPMVVGPGRYVGHSFTNYGVISYEESTDQNYCMSPSSPAVGQTLTASFTYSTRSYSMMTYYTCGLPTWTVYDNHDCQGNDIGTTHVSTIYECEKACKANPDCGAVVFAPGLADQGQTSCWFKAMGACTPAPYTGPVTGGLMVAIPNDVVVALTGDNSYKLFVDGDLKWEDGVWDTVEEYPLPYTMQVVAVFSQNTGGPGGILLSTNTGFWSDSDWKCTLITDVNNFDWTMPDFDDSSWEFATVYGDKTHPTWSGASALDLIHTNAKWIWTHDLNNHMNVGCRKRYAAFAALSCTVDLSSAGLNDADKTLSWAHANSQKETVFQKRSYSFFEIQVSKTSCALGTQHHFDTFDGATKVNDMVNYMNGLSAGTLIACATWDENSANMPGDGYNTLMSVFGVDATSLEHRGSISFVATVGDASKQTSVIKGSTVGPATLVAVYQYEMVLYKSNKKSDVSPASTSTVPDADRCAQLCNVDDACTYAGTVQQSGGIDADWDCHSYTSDVSGGTFSDVTGYKLYRAERITKSVVTN